MRNAMIFAVALCATANNGCNKVAQVPTELFPVGGVTKAPPAVEPAPVDKSELPKLVIDQAGRTYAHNVCVTFSAGTDVTAAEWYAVDVRVKGERMLRTVRLNTAQSWELLDTNCAGGLPLRGVAHGEVTYNLLVSGMVDSRSVSRGSGWVSIVPDPMAVVRKSGGGANTSWVATSSSRCVVEHQGHCFDSRSQTCDGGSIVQWLINGSFNCPGAQKCCVGGTIADTGAPAPASVELKERTASPVSPAKASANPPRPEPISGKATRINAVSK